MHIVEVLWGGGGGGKGAKLGGFDLKIEKTQNFTSPRPET